MMSPESLSGEKLLLHDLLTDGKVIDDRVRMLMNDFTMEMIKQLVQGQSYKSAYISVIQQQRFNKYKDNIIWFKGQNGPNCKFKPFENVWDG